MSVALELLTKPSLLFLDEPVSGLDPGLDKSVMQMLRGLPLLILCIGGCLTGAAKAVRELVKERPIYQGERAVGLSRSAYLAAKLIVLGVITIGQGIVLTLVAMLGVKTHDKGVFTAPMTELVLAAALLSYTAMTLGLLISALVKTSEMTMPLLVLSTLVQVVFCGALAHLDGKAVLEQISWAVPARWALAAMAGTLNVGRLIPHVQDPPDPLWKQDLGTWALNMGAMVLQVVVLSFLVSRMLRRQEPQVMRK